MIPNIQLILEALERGPIDPSDLIETLMIRATKADVIEGIQRAIEQGKIMLDGKGMVVPGDAEA